MTATAIPADAPAPPINRLMVTVSIMMATTMTILDTTIANVALPHMAGSMSASAEQITWVLTSYIVASAIVTPMSGWLAGRFGRKQVFVFAIIGFTLASALCGAAQNLAEIVIFRVIQGMAGAVMGPIAQAVMIDTYSYEKRGQAMSIWGMAAMVAPVFGPVLGGWLTDSYSWRWVFYINMPFGVLSLVGVLTFVKDETRNKKLRFDAIGFSLLSLAVAGLQICLDRGQDRGWFDSTEIVIEAAVSGVAFLLFVIHSLTAETPFIPLALFKDRNYVGATLIGFFTGMLFFSVLALLPTMMQTLLGYPVVTSGLVSAPRGIGSFISMYFGGRLVNRVDNRLLMILGTVLLAFSFFQMSEFSLGMDATSIVWTGLFQGLATGLLFLPMSTLAFATLRPELRTDGAGAFSLTRNIGNSLGISIMQTLFARNAGIVHARLAEPIHPDNPLMQSYGGAYNLSQPSGMAALVGEVSRQASMVAYVDVFRVMCLVTLFSAPLIFLLKTPPPGLTQQPAPVE